MWRLAVTFRGFRSPGVRTGARRRSAHGQRHGDIEPEKCEEDL